MLRFSSRQLVLGSVCHDRSGSMCIAPLSHTKATIGLYVVFANDSPTTVDGSKDENKVISFALILGFNELKQRVSHPKSFRFTRYEV